MKSLRSIASLFLAILVFFSSTSFMVGMHVCGGKIENMALFTKAAGCEMEKKMPPCHKHASKPCCQDEKIVHDAQDFKNDVNQTNSDSQNVGNIVKSPVLIAEVIPTTLLSKFKYLNYDTPLRAEDLTVSHQVFLI